MDGAVAPEPPEEEFARFDNRWLLYAPLVGSYLAIPAAAVGAGFRLLDELGRSVQPDLDELDLAGGWAPGGRRRGRAAAGPRGRRGHRRGGGQLGLLASCAAAVR